MTLRRVAFLRKPSDASHASIKVAKPAPGPRKVACKACRVRFVPDRPSAKVCSADCAIAAVAADKAKQERKETRARRQAMKSRTDWLKEAQAAVNALVRYRDRHDPCISCDRPATWDGQWHASHFKSVGASPATRFDMSNIHKACSICNNHLSGNIGAYTPRLLAKVGQAEFDRLNGPHPVVKLSIEEIAAIKQAAVTTLRELKSGAQ